uniref:Synembryn-A n=1 Tax=Trichuris muris TaxID=70415 RepID=A0A5S6QET6_TRIMR
MISTLPLAKAGVVIHEFVENSLEKFDFSTETYLAKAAVSLAVVRRFSELVSDPSLAFSTLQLVRILSRDSYIACGLSKENFLDTLFSVAGFGPRTVANGQTTLEAKKCCCNLFFLSSRARREFKRYSELAESIRSAEDIQCDEVIFDLKIVFLLSGLSRDDPQFFDDCLIHSALFSLLERLVGECVGPFTNRYVLVSNECLKALFNVLSLRNAAPGKDALGSEISHELASLMKAYIARRTVDEEKEIEFHTNAINLLTLLHPSYYGLLFKKDLTVGSSELSEEDATDSSSCVLLDNLDLTPIEVILQVLSSQCDTTTARNHEFIRPTLVLLTSIASWNSSIRRYIRHQVLPPLRDVLQRPEVGHSLRNKVVRLMTSVSDVNAVAAEFLFVLCNFNVNRLIKYTGFGNAAGLLSSNGLLCKYAVDQKTEAHVEETDEDSDTEEYLAMRDKINPVLGCYEPDRPSSTDDMSEEQKEFEAMQLVNKIDEMMKHGVVVPGHIDKDGKVRPIEHVLQLQESNINMKKKPD